MNIFRHWTSNDLKGPVPADSASAPMPAGGNGRSNDAKADLEEDARLVHQAQQGDTQAFDQLVSKHRGKIYAMTVNMIKNDADAWDLTQEAFVKAWRGLPKFEHKARFSTWLFRISHNVVYDWLRKQKIHGDGEFNDEILSSENIEPSAPTAPHHHLRPDEAMERKELRVRLQRAISKLSEEHREVILLREVQGLDYKEIAEITQHSMGTVMSRLHYARKKLQSILTK